MINATSAFPASSYPTQTPSDSAVLSTSAPQTTASTPPDFTPPPAPPKPKGKFHLNLVMGILVLLLLLVGGGSTYYLASQNQDLRNKASTGPGYTECYSVQGGKCVSSGIIADVCPTSAPHRSLAACQESIAGNVQCFSRMGDAQGCSATLEASCDSSKGKYPTKEACEATPKTGCKPGYVAPAGGCSGYRVTN